MLIGRQHKRRTIWFAPLPRHLSLSEKETHLRGRETIDTTTIEWYAKAVPKMIAAGNLLMLSGVEQVVYERLKKTDVFELIGAENIFQTQKVIGALVDKALDAAEKWIAENQKRAPSNENESG